MAPESVRAVHVEVSAVDGEEIELRTAGADGAPGSAPPPAKSGSETR